MEILTGTILKIIEYTVEPIGRQVGYLINYKSNLESLTSQLKNLDAAKDRMKHRVDEAERNGKGVETDVQNWRKEADGITQEAEKILGNEGQAKTKCLRGVCPNLVSYHQFSRKSAKLTKKIEIHAKKEFSSVSYEAPVEDICAIRSQEYMAFESRTSMLKRIMEELKNPDTNMIGVYGLGGVGKTTLGKEVFRQVNKEEKLFDNVVIILNVKEKKDIEIQKEIAEKLGMEVKESQSMAVRANCLCLRIKDKKTLVILDDILGRIDLEAVGLVCVRTCKLLLTSRDKKVLFSEMGTQKNFLLDLLCEQESLSLFEKRAGAVIKDDRIQRVANELAKKCGGLPILVVAVASGLRESSLEEWKDTLRRFKNFEEEGLTDIAFLIIEWSYNRLHSEELKRLFLLCGIMAEGQYAFFLSDLLKYTIGLGLFKNVRTVEEAWNALLSSVKKLKDSCLLLDGYDDRSVRMHDVVRDVAVRIAYRDHHVLSRACTELDQSPSKDCSLISLRRCTIPELPDVPWECPELNFFYLGSSDNSLEIPCNFFEKMNSLKVLDLTRLHFPSLPLSLQSLTNLQTLCLDGCVLGDIALVGQLTNLKILSLIHSEVKELPEEIGQLTRLQLLDLSYCSELVRISPGVISSLTSLEDLRMGNFKEWEGGLNDGRSNASVSELKQLRQLTALEIQIPDAKLLPANMFSDTRLERYTILIGDCWLYPDNFETSSLTLRNMPKLIGFSSQGSTSVVSTEAEEIILENEIGGPTILFMNREVLMPNLTSLVVDGCGGLRFLFSSSMARILAQLKRLKISKCQIMEEIVSTNESNEEDTDHNMFSQLQDLSLQYLPNLTRFCSARRSINFHSLEKLHLEDCSKLETFIFDPMSTNITINKAIEEIRDSTENIGTDARYFLFDEKVLMPNLTRLTLHQCDDLRFLFTCSMARSLVQLEHIVISKCQMMEEIVSTSGYNQEHTNNMFCNLKSLELQHLPSLTRFCSGSYLEFSLLERLLIEDCPRLGTFIFDRKSEITSMGKENDDRNSKENLETVVPHFLFDEKVGFPSLERFIIRGLPVLRTIWHNRLAPNSFCKLKKVEVLRCNTLINIFAPSMMGRLNALDTLEIRECKSLQAVFEQTYDTSTTKLFMNGEGNPFPSLETLCLDTEIWYEAHDPLPVELFINLKAIQFSCAHPQSFHFLQKLHNLEKLGVRGGPWKEIFVYEGTSSGEIDAVVTTLPHIKNLSLTKMEELMHLGNDNSELIFPNLEILIVCGCGRLKNLTSSTISFHNLTALYVDSCMGLNYLVTYSVAKCLHQLKALIVRSCKSITEIVAINGDEEDSGNNYEITFSSLQHLELRNLPSLRGFCSSGNCTIRVPSLNYLNVYCYLIELKISPDGSLIQSGSRPERQQITEEVEEEEDDANETGGKQLIAHTN